VNLLYQMMYYLEAVPSSMSRIHKYILRLLYPCLPTFIRRKICSRLFFPGKRSVLMQIFTRAFEIHFYAASDAQQRKMNKVGFWFTDHATRWHIQKLNDQQYLDQMLEVRSHLTLFIQNVISLNPDIDTVVEIGCGNGFYLNFLSSILPSELVLLGTDVNKGIIDFNSTYYPNLSFVYSSAPKLIASLRSKSLLVIAGGTLLCFTPGELGFLLNVIKSNRIRSHLCFCENSHKEFSPSERFLPLKNTAFSHNYNLLLKEAGYSIDFSYCSELKFGMIKQTISASTN